ncbi:MAG: VWA domain-containing protein [Pseudomonadota bacterium]
MTDEMKKLEHAMRAAPAPSQRARKAAMDAALRAFDDEFEATSQETPQAARQTKHTQPLWSRLMTILKQNIALRPLLMGGTSVAALSLAVFVSLNVPGEDTGPVAKLETVQNTSPEDVGKEARENDLLTKARPARPNAEQQLAETEEALIGPAIAAAPAADAEAPAVSPLRRTAPSALSDHAQGSAIVALPLPEPVIQQPEVRDQFANADANPVKLVTEAPVSTFSIDVDTASYAWMRRSLREGQMPDPQSVRVEELINYFPYDYKAPDSAETAFAVSTTLTEAPWAAGRQLLHIGIRGYQPEARPRANFTFLIDTSGSMSSPDKLPLLLTSFRLMLDSLGDDDTVAIVTYAGSSSVALEPTKVADKGAILDALDRLQSGGGTAGAAGINTAYRLAEDRFDEDAINRVILATDGDFNIGAASVDEMKTLIAEKRETGVFLSVLGFGRGNLNDDLMQTLAQEGNGQAAYIDTLAEARKALVEETASLMPIAKDVKIQIEFNPAAVQDYRLIGYETRALNREDFNNDKVDAGEIGAGHRVTAIYEITPVGGPTRIDDLRYQSVAEQAEAPKELAFLKLRHKAPDADESQLTETAIAPDETEAGEEARFAIAVAGFGQVLRGSTHLGDWSYDDALALASGARGEDRFGYRAEFLDLVRLARSLDR